MPSQTKHFIEPSDIRAVQFECNTCRLVVSIPVTQAKTLLNFTSCPGCKGRWLQVGSSTLEPDIKTCIEALNAAVEMLDSWPKLLDAAGEKGFKLTLEVRKPVDAIQSNQ